MTIAEHLRARADSYSRDAQVFRHDGDLPMAAAYQTIADELRKCADNHSANAPTPQEREKA